MLFFPENTPLCKDFGVHLELRSGFSIYDSVFVTVFDHVIQDNGIDAGTLQIRTDGDQEHIQGIVVVQSL